MKMLTEYLERALEFEGLAIREDNEAFKAELQKQAAGYRKLAEKRADNMDFLDRAPQRIALAGRRSAVSKLNLVPARGPKLPFGGPPTGRMDPTDENRGKTSRRAAT